MQKPLWEALKSWPRSWPSRCWVCGAWACSPCCPECRAQHARLHPRCPRCSLRLAPGVSTCQHCRHQAPTDLDSTHARVDYRFPWAGLVQQLKFQQSPASAGVLAELMLEDAKALETARQCDCLTPIPLDRQRLQSRGYNQSWELIRQLRRRAPLPPAWPDLLQRPTGVAALHTLPRAERWQQAQHLFQANPAHQATLQSARVLLVDDVMTTGATASAAAQTLLQAGARSVRLWVFARTPAASGDAPGME